jgi:hypothetical protein
VDRKNGGKKCVFLRKILRRVTEGLEEDRGNSFLSLEKPDIYYSDITIGIGPVYIKSIFLQSKLQQKALSLLTIAMAMSCKCFFCPYITVYALYSVYCEWKNIFWNHRKRIFVRRKEMYAHLYNIGKYQEDFRK